MHDTTTLSHDEETICQVIDASFITDDTVAIDSKHIEAQVQTFAEKAAVLPVRKTIFKHRTAVERVNAYLKEYFQLNNTRPTERPKCRMISTFKNSISEFCSF